MKAINKIEIYNASAANIFSRIDDRGVTGMHMVKSSAGMVGSKLQGWIEVVSLIIKL